MTPEELFEEALAIYVEMLLLGANPSPMAPPSGATAAWVDSLDTCEAPDAGHREYWIRLSCVPSDGRLWVLFGKVPHGSTSMNGLARLFWKLANDVSLFNALKPAV
jgi:hypothetical protein